jgi:hypothetical protein
MCREELQTQMMPNVTDPILKFNETVISKDDKTIQRTSKNPKHPSKPWFNDDCEDALSKLEKWRGRGEPHVAPVVLHLLQTRCSVMNDEM